MKQPKFAPNSTTTTTAHDGLPRNQRNSTKNCNISKQNEISLSLDLDGVFISLTFFYLLLNISYEYNGAQIRQRYSNRRLKSHRQKWWKHVIYWKQTNSSGIFIILSHLYLPRDTHMIFSLWMDFSSVCLIFFYFTFRPATVFFMFATSLFLSTMVRFIVSFAPAIARDREFLSSTETEFVFVTRDCFFLPLSLVLSFYLTMEICGQSQKKTHTHTPFSMYTLQPDCLV